MAQRKGRTLKSKGQIFEDLFDPKGTPPTARALSTPAKVNGRGELPATVAPQIQQNLPLVNGEARRPSQLPLPAKKKNLPPRPSVGCNTPLHQISSSSQEKWSLVDARDIDLTLLPGRIQKELKLFPDLSPQVIGALIASFPLFAFRNKDGRLVAFERQPHPHYQCLAARIGKKVLVVEHHPDDFALTADQLSTTIWLGPKFLPSEDIASVIKPLLNEDISFLSTFKNLRSLRAKFFALFKNLASRRTIHDLMLDYKGDE